jgi:secondary thiamine-phosphate synthase enzyme
LDELKRLVPWKGNYKHVMEVNASAHIKSVLVDPTKVVLVDRGKLALGIWQGIFLAEFDGPRKPQA